MSIQVKNSGLLIVNKPSGPTSHDVVNKIRNILKIRKAGHCGTLDPMAKGLLLVLIGDATKLQRKYLGMNKTYEGTLKLGVTTDTDDITGNVLKKAGFAGVSEENIKSSFKKFLGTIKQVSPRYSAVKFKGKKLYEYARKGINTILPPRIVDIYKFESTNMRFPYVDFEVECSTGTYVRSLVRDAGENLGCGAVLTELTRTKIGDILLNDAVDWDRLTDGSSQGIIKDIKQA